MRDGPAPPIEVIRLPGRVAYPDGLRLQHERQKAVEDGRKGDALFLLEHAPVMTLGRKAHETNLLRPRAELEAMGIAVCETDRGGDVTYHGPGQLVAYPILDLNRWKPAIRGYLRTLEGALIRQLGRYGLEAGRLPGYTGVWVEGAKVAAIGVGIHNWVTCHGVALNVSPDMDHFGLIIPCGIVDKPVTSLARLMHEPPTMSQAMDDFQEEFLRGLQEWRATADNAPGAV